MSSHDSFYDDQGPKEEPKDRTKWLWLGVFALFAVMVGVLWFASRSGSDVTRVRAKHILIKCNANDPVDRARALELISQLKRDIEEGASFSKLAKEYSNDEFSSARGGDLGYYARKVFEPAFEQFVWTAPIGQLSDIITTSHGFHLAIVTDRHISKADQYDIDLEMKATQGSTPPAPDAAPPPVGK